MTALTTDGSETTINGTSDWVYEEELFLRDCFRWSPDGRRIAYWQFDTTGVGIFSLIDDTVLAVSDDYRASPIRRSGRRTPLCASGSSALTEARLAGCKPPANRETDYLASLEWIDEETVGMQQLNRLQNRNDFLVGDVQTGSVSRIFRDESNIVGRRDR